MSPPRHRPRRILVTGGAGFIGSNLVHWLLRKQEASAVERVVVLDALTYAGHWANLEGLEEDPRFHFVEGDVCDGELVRRIFREHAFDSVLHLAAESHVDRSIEDASIFVRTNVMGSFTLFDAAARHWADALEDKRFIHVSTDEVYGALGEDGVFTEATPYAPNSPYAASKASSDLLARSFFKTYGLPVVITNCSNNYGPHQLPEKLIPLMICNAAADKSLPVYGEGKQVRDWLHVEDHCRGLWEALVRGAPGEKYNFGGGTEAPNLEIVRRIADAVDEHLGRPSGSSRSLITFVQDRPGHDFRYAIDPTKSRSELGWEALEEFGEGLRKTVAWYLEHQQWIERVQSEEHARFQEHRYGAAGR